MVAPLVVAGIAATAAMSGIGGTILGGLFGGTKKEEHITETNTYGQVYHAPGEVYSPQIQYAPQYGYSYVGATYQINSPDASSKKSASVNQTSTPSQEGLWEVPQSYETSPQVTSGGGLLDNNTLIILAIVGGVGIIGYGLVSGGKK